MASVDLGDARLERRAGLILEKLEKTPQGTLLGAMPTKAELAASYRFLHNPAVDAAELIGAHAQASGERAGRGLGHAALAKLGARSGACPNTRPRHGGRSATRRARAGFMACRPPARCRRNCRTRA
ncbi:MAG: IS4/Tn5 family transposase DNA-binding protein [Candidatus Acidiferrales bacterium]